MDSTTHLKHQQDPKVTGCKARSVSKASKCWPHQSNCWSEKVNKHSPWKWAGPQTETIVLPTIHFQVRKCFREGNSCKPKTWAGLWILIFKTCQWAEIPEPPAKCLARFLPVCYSAIPVSIPLSPWRGFGTTPKQQNWTGIHGEWRLECISNKQTSS